MQSAIANAVVLSLSLALPLAPFHRLRFRLFPFCSSRTCFVPAHTHAEKRYVYVCRNQRLWNTTEERIPQDRSPRSIAAIYTVKGKRARAREGGREGGREGEREKEAEIERGNHRDRRVPGPRPASLPVTRRESRRPARKRPVGISIFLRPFPLPRRALHRAIPHQPVGWSTSANAAFDSFLLCPAIARERRNEEVTIAKPSLKRVSKSRLSLRNNDEFCTPKNPCVSFQFLQREY